MSMNTEWLKDLISFLRQPYFYLPAILIGSVLTGVIAELIVGRMIGRFTSRTKTALDDKLLRALKRPIAISIMLFGVWLTLSLSGLSPALVSLTKSAIATLAIVIWTFFLFEIATATINYFSAVRDVLPFFQPQTKPLLLMGSKILIIAAALYLLSNAWSWDLSAWIASAGIAGIAIGFAAKDTLANLFAGIFIIADQPYRIDDYVVLDSTNNPIRGKVTHIGLRSTRILTRDDVEVIVPNGIIGNSTIINESGGPYEKFRIAVDCSVAYGSDVDAVEEILLKVAEDEPLVVNYPEARVRFRSFGDSGLIFALLVWVEKPELRGLALHLLNQRIYKALNAAGIEIPYPKRDVYLHQA